MSFLLDPPILYAAGRAYGAAAPESAQGSKAAVVGTLATAALVGASVALWLDHPATKPLWKAFGARSGREYQAFTGLRDWDGAGQARPGRARAGGGRLRRLPARLVAGLGQVAAGALMASDARERLIAALREHALVIGEVTLTSGAVAQYLIDAKRAILLPDGFLALGELVAAQARATGAPRRSAA